MKYMLNGLIAQVFDLDRFLVLKSVLYYGEIKLLDGEFRSTCANSSWSKPWVVFVFLEALQKMHSRERDSKSRPLDNQS